MKDDYLWDGSGEPDTEVQKLESLLACYRHDQPAPAFVLGGAPRAAGRADIVSKIAQR